MYKVYVNDKPIILSDRMQTLLGFEVYLYKNTRIEEVIHKLQFTQTQGIYLYNNDLDVLWENFKKSFVLVYAAGGLVINNQDEILLIKRNGYWDLPKGRVEIGENSQFTALREVEEECSISNLEIIEDLPVTYHIYQEKGVEKLKKTYWYIMKTNDVAQPSPQIEEGITEVIYININKIENCYPTMYLNIKDLIDYFLSNKFNPNL